MLVHEFLARPAAATPEVVAAIDQAGEITYGALDRVANRIGRVLIDRGVEPGDRVVLALENSIDWIACYFGILKAGGVAVPVPAGPRSDRFPHVIHDCRPRVCMVDPTTAPAVAPTLAESAVQVLIVVTRSDRAAPDLKAPVPVVTLTAAIEAVPAADPGVRRIDLDLAAIIYTSGSTGAPRGVMLSHLNIHANTESIVEYLGLSPADRMMVVLPFHYVYGLSLLHTHLYVGGSLVIDNRFAFPNVVLRAMQVHAVTGLAGVPSTFAFLLHRSALKKMTFPGLRYVTQAGGAMPQALIREWHAAMPGVPLFVMYGATEASARLSYLNPTELFRRPGSIGRAIPNVELMVIRDDGTRAAAGEVGELVARGSNIMMGYWSRPDETAAAMGPHGYRTGDLALSDEDGFLYLVGRRQDFIKVGGHRVGAREIEEVLHDHPAVHEAAVVAAADEMLGEVPVAFATLRDARALDPGELILFCRRRLPDHKVPSRVLIVSDLPRTEAGKVDKHVLRRAIGEIVRSSAGLVGATSVRPDVAS